MALELLLQEAEGLSEESLMQVVRFIKSIKTENKSVTEGAPKKKIREAGIYKGQIVMADDFDSPLDEINGGYLEDPQLFENEDQDGAE